MIVTDLQYIPADETHRRAGLRGWVRVELAGAVVVDGLAIRRTHDGHLLITWPRRPNGRLVATPASEAARRRIETAILQAFAAEVGA